MPSSSSSTVIVELSMAAAECRRVRLNSKASKIDTYNLGPEIRQFRYLVNRLNEKCALPASMALEKLTLKFGMYPFPRALVIFR